jgi:hypothetical protein
MPMFQSKGIGASLLTGAGLVSTIWLLFRSHENDQENK